MARGQAWVNVEGRLHPMSRDWRTLASSTLLLPQHGKTALTLAASKGQVGVVGLLLDGGANIEAKNTVCPPVTLSGLGASSAITS